MIPEPIAGVVHSFIPIMDAENNTDAEQHTIVRKTMIFAALDIGGGTYDTSIVEAVKTPCRDSNNEEFGQYTLCVRSVGGNQLLGGKDYDAAIASLLGERLKLETQFAPSDDDYLEIEKKAETVKILLSNSADKKVRHNFKITSADNPSKKTVWKVNLTLTDVLEYEPVKAFQKILKKELQRVLEDAEVDIKDIQKLILIGGSAQGFAASDVYEQFHFPHVSNIQDCQTSVAKGAAIYAHWKNVATDEVIIKMATAKDIGIRVSNGTLSTVCIHKLSVQFLPKLYVQFLNCMYNCFGFLGYPAIYQITDS